MILAIDPGHEGGAVLLDGRGLPVAWWSWKPLDRKSGRVYAIDRSDAAWDRITVRTLAGVGAELALSLREERQSGLHLVAEGLFVHPGARGGRAHAAIELGKSVGWLTAPLLESALSYEEPRSAVWRPAVLGPGSNASSDIAEARALALWSRRWTGPPCPDPHVAEAYCIGWWRHTRRAA